MTVVIFEGKTFTSSQGETVLDTLLGGGAVVPYGCRAGVCQACMLSAEQADEAVKRAQSGLSDTQKALNFFLSCQCLPEGDLSVKLARSSNQEVTATVVDKQHLNAQVIRLRLAADIRYRAGQFVNLMRDSKLMRSYSLASVPGDEWLELHLRLYPEGKFSTWVDTELQIGDTLTLKGPLGECIYVAEDKNQPLLLLGTGTGLAPLFGIIRDALSQGHTGPMHLVLAASDGESFYYREELAELARQHANLDVTWVVQTGDEAANQVVGDVYSYAKGRFTDLKGYKVYLCGAKTFVTKLKKQCFLSGAGVRDIVADTFLPADV